MIDLNDLFETLMRGRPAVQNAFLLQTFLSFDRTVGVDRWLGQNLDTATPQAPAKLYLEMTRLLLNGEQVAIFGNSEIPGEDCWDPAQTTACVLPNELFVDLCGRFEQALCDAWKGQAGQKG